MFIVIKLDLSALNRFSVYSKYTLSNKILQFNGYYMGDKHTIDVIGQNFMQHGILKCPQLTMSL